MSLHSPSMPIRTSHPRFDVVISDIDGCLGSEGAEALDLASLSRVAEHNRLAQEKHDRPVLTVCSGRPQPFAEGMLRLVGNMTLPGVSENGVWLYHAGTNEYMMDPAITPEHRAAVREAAAWLEATYGPRGVTQQPGKAASVSLYHPETPFLRTLAPGIAAEFQRRGWPFRVSMTWLYINCDLAHITKGTGLDRLFALTGLTRARAAGIGDTTSDVPIRERVAWFACPANAQEEIKKLADYVSPHPEAKGVVDILEQLSRITSEK